jgi:hypothetical protein
MIRDESVTRVRLEPPIGQWAPRSPVIGTGHQAWLWHPGILAKDLAGRVVADRRGGTLLHLVVDHDAHEALQLALPVRAGDALRREVVRLGQHRADVPTGWQPAVDSSAVAQRLVDLDRDDVRPLADAWREAGPAASLGRQIGRVLAILMRPWAGELELWHTSDMIRESAFAEVVGALRDDPLRAARSYNRAVGTEPGAGVAPLMVGRELVEVPLWAVAWNRPRQRVFVDVADRAHRFALADGVPIDPAAFDLAPRALLLTAMMRSRWCGLFIHGTGGYTYDRITDRWWQAWRGELLAPMALATADLHLPFEAPMADVAAYRRAVWYRHHAPHNVDRLLGEPDARKAALLAHMDADRDRDRRRAAFQAIHRINAELVRQHPAVLEQADARLRNARVGLANAALAARRDWCFALYRDDTLAALRDAIASADLCRT